MKLRKNDHTVTTSDPTEQVKLKSLGYAEVKETTAPLAESEKAQLKDDVAKVIEVAKAVTPKNKNTNKNNMKENNND